ncbi:ABC transporter permease [Terribacillus halophilus]|uniref:ABC transporter permease n=1 Tax=Terribacillus halophilus TaxID=361279 RepID=UPI000985DF70|nr:ABC transporter permease [Terribacillus halophilus]
MKPIMLTVSMESKRMLKDKYFLVFSLLLPFVLYSLFTYINRGQAIGQIDFDYYFLISMTCYSLVVTSVQTFGIQIMYDRKQTWMAYLFTHPISAAQYFAARMITQLLLNTLIIAFFFFISNAWKQFDRPLGEWLVISLWLLMGSILFLAIGILIAQTKKLQTASVTANILVLTFAILGGLWMPLETFPNWVQAIGEWLPSHIYAQGAWRIAATGSLAFSNIILLVCYFLVSFIGVVFLQYKQRS